MITGDFIPVSCPQDALNILNDLEQKLADAKARRDKILFDIRKAQAAIDAGDQRARFTQGGLNKQNVDAGRLIISIEREVGEAKKRLDMVVEQAEGAAAKQASADDAALVRDKLFEVVAPDGRKLRHYHASAEALSRALESGYSIVGQVFGHAEDGSGGFIDRPGAPSMMKALLESQGDVLMEWLEARGITGNPVKVILPSNGRENMQ